METATKAARAARTDGQETKPPDKSQSQVEQGKEPERGQASGQPRRRPEKVFRVGNCWGTVWCNEHQQKSGPNQHTTRIIRSVNLERRFWNEKLKDGKGDWDSTSCFGRYSARHFSDSRSLIMLFAWRGSGLWEPGSAEPFNVPAIAHMRSVRPVGDC